MAVVAEAYEAQTTITKAMLPLLKKLVLLEGFEFMRHRFGALHQKSKESAEGAQCESQGQAQ